MEELRRRLREADDTLDALRRGAVDAVVVDGPHGQQIYTLESADQPFRIFVERMQEGAITLDAEGTLLYCNPYFAQLLQRPASQVMGARLEAFLTADSHAPCREAMRAAPTQPSRVECRLAPRAGKAVLVEFAFSVLPSSVTLIGAVVTDLTAREEAKRLEVERKAAEEANTARDRFLAMISHELRTPLNAITGWVQVLGLRKDLPEAAMRGLEIIERSGWAQAQLIDDLLDVSRILAGKLRLETAPVDLAAVATAAIASAQPQADAKDIRLVPRLGDHSVVVQGDVARLRQIISNLVVNAIKYTPEGGEVSVELREDADAVEVEVADNGVGIAPNDLPRMFGLFEQVETGTRRRGGGLGLGLAIVKQLVELHGGEVRLLSDGEGRGTTARVRLPRPDSEAPTRAERERAATAHLDGLRILLVEDEDQARETLAEWLRGAHARVTTAATADEALRAVQGDTFDVLVSDLGLPDVDGLVLIERIRAAGVDARALPALALTAYAGADYRRQVLEAGYQAHLPKPARYDALCGAILELGRKGAG
ncbi:response regulator [Ectothiorhodospiraceae bacterium 2226]|nr:response regulator [Ectothiorhodospiraceae bacterium 2226]